jgi:D-glycero-alpha-D-manno-heptose-7-phosphate kinase
MYISHCPLRISLFGGSTDNPYFVEKYGYGSVISFASTLKTYVTVGRDLFGVNNLDHKYRLNYSKREDVSTIQDIKNEVIRVVLEHFNIDPVQINLFGDAYSQGSGLASSSSYIISLIKSMCMFLNKNMSEVEICSLAYSLERKFNPYCGYQDPYGCGVGGFKRIEFYPNNRVTYDYLPTSFFDSYDIHLIFTGVTRNSKNVLKDVSQNLDKVKNLLPIVDEAYDAIISNNHMKVFDLLSESWEEKKKTSSIITENETIKFMDQELYSNKSVLCHKLCGAGNGGFFLAFSEKESLNIPYHSVKIGVSSQGVSGYKV